MSASELEALRQAYDAALTEYREASGRVTKAQRALEAAHAAAAPFQVGDVAMWGLDEVIVRAVRGSTYGGVTYEVSSRKKSGEWGERRRRCYGGMKPVSVAS